ncbi:MAG: Rieske (2Fe-2S) protein [Nitrososphaerales archaeon]
MCRWCKVAEFKDIQPNSIKEFQVERNKILLINTQDQLYALEASCPHMGYPLRFGSLSGKVLRCGFHYAEFNIEDGSVLAKPVDSDTRGLKRYPVKVEEGIIFVQLEDEK